MRFVKILNDESMSKHLRMAWRSIFWKLMLYAQINPCCFMVFINDFPLTLQFSHVTVPIEDLINIRLCPIKMASSIEVQLLLILYRLDIDYFHLI